MGRLFSVPIVQKEEIPRTIGKKHTSPYSSEAKNAALSTCLQVVEEVSKLPIQTAKAVLFDK